MAGHQEALTPDQAALVEQHISWATSGAVIGRATRRQWRDDQADLDAEAYYGLVKAALTFDPDRGVPFKTFASWKIRGRILDARRDRMRVMQGLWKGRRLMAYHPAFWPVDKQTGEPMDFEAPGDLDQQIEFRLALRRLKVRNQMERRIVLGYLAGYDNQEIAKLVGRSRSRVDQLLRRIGIPAMKKAA